MHKKVCWTGSTAFWIVVVVAYVLALILWASAYVSAWQGRYSEATYHLLLGHLVFKYLKVPEEPKENQNG